MPARPNTAHTYLSAPAKQRLELLEAQLRNDYSRFIGFPATLDFDYAELLPFLSQVLNNVGDPYVSTWHGVHTKEFEQEVVDFFAELFRAPKGKYWGYVTNGSSECNLYALYVARQKYPNAPVYYSKTAHYGIPKNILLLGMNGVPLDTLPSGEMDYEHLRRELKQRSDTSAIVVATIGTTMTEAKDNVATIKQILLESGVTGSYIHADAALAGTYTALLEPRWPFDFEDGADSVNVSGHKFLGSPVPCGVIIVKKDHQKNIKQNTNYTGSPDSTITGSRNGHTPLIMWYAIQRWGKEGLRQRALGGFENAEYACRRLQAVGWPAWRNPNALTVMLASPSDHLIHKWQLANTGGWSHIICMPGITKDKIDRFIDDLCDTHELPATTEILEVPLVRQRFVETVAQ